MPGTDASASLSPSLRRWAAFLILLGLYLTIRGYRSFEGDQAYRFPILRRAQDFRLFKADPFVRSFDGFNPHRGYFTLLDAASRPAGLATAVLVLYVLTYGVSCLGLDRLTRAVWSDRRGECGVVTVALWLIAQAGNVGTNHLFEPILLDRLLGFGLGWVGLAAVVSAPKQGAWVMALMIGVSGTIHPSVGLQLAIVISVGWIAWWCLGLSEGMSAVTAFGFFVLFGVSSLPGALVNLRHSDLLTLGLSPAQVLLLSAELQSPQHMLPHLWRLPQWVAWGCYPLLAFVAFGASRSVDAEPEPLARRRVAVLIVMMLAGLAVAWLGIERLGNLRLTLFQPFRMATVARGLCLVLVAGHVMRLWDDGSVLGRLRAVLIAVGFAGDRMLAVVTLFEVTMAGADLVRGRSEAVSRAGRAIGFGLLGMGLVFLSRHDTESGHLPLIVAIGATLAWNGFVRERSFAWNRRRVAFRLVVSWMVPLAALGANMTPETILSPGVRAWRQILVRHCRFAEVPVDDLERLALWCRANTPDEAVFIGPPGPKTFRLWSSRSLAFNRAASPYAAEGLADWARRFADHVGVVGPPEALVAEYRKDRHGLERRYDGLSPDDLTALARRQGAGYVVALSSGRKNPEANEGGLASLHVEGRYTVYKVSSPPLAWKGGQDGRSTGR